MAWYIFKEFSRVLHIVGVFLLALAFSGVVLTTPPLSVSTSTMWMLLNRPLKNISNLSIARHAARTNKEEHEGGGNRREASTPPLHIEIVSNKTTVNSGNNVHEPPAA